MVAVELRRMTIAGRTVLVVPRREDRRDIPPTLALLLDGGRDTTGRYWPRFRPASRRPLRIGGAAASCLASSNGDPELDHRLGVWLEGFYLGLDGVARFLSLHACADCGAVCVRDRSIDDELVRSFGLSAGRRPLRRKDEVIGWYAGARPRDRVYT